MDKTEQRAAPPVVAYKTFENANRMFASGVIPGRIDRGVFRSQSGAGQTQIIAAYRYLDVIDAQGAPKEKFVKLVRSEGADRQKVLRDILYAAYPFLREKSIDLGTATHDQLADEFRKLASGDTVRKAMTFFIPAAKAAGIELSPYIRDIGKRMPTNNKQRKPPAPPKPQDKTDTGNRGDAPPPPAMSWREMLLSKFPSFDPTWPDDVKAKWFDSFADLMERGEKK